MDLKKTFVIAVAYLALLAHSLPAAAVEYLPFNALPKAVQETVLSKQKACVKEDKDNTTGDNLSGVTFIDLDASGHTDVALYHGKICKYPTKGSVCSTGGCDLEIWKQVNGNSWTKIFNENVLPEPWFATNADGSFRALGLNVLRWDKPCHLSDGNGPKTLCNYIVFRENERWEWINLENIVQLKIENYRWEGLWANNKEQCKCNTYAIEMCPTGHGIPPLLINRNKIVAAELSCEITRVNSIGDGIFELVGRCSSEGDNGSARIKGSVSGSTLKLSITGEVERVWRQGDYNSFSYKCN
jgi:hypothetical protein